MAGNTSKLLLVFLIGFLLINTEFVAADKAHAKKKTCERKSNTWTGVCLVSSNCEKHCKKQDKALKGSCHQVDFFTRACMCKFKC
ncbi:defensin-like protein 1 [Cornus florida]|uniref:defensin-like protein 1 n=1 Tax=Cornus florida TaxID=4283 RepID=UPI002896DEAF|nr:defensin-like protein 1 [Cornus florida]